MTRQEIITECETLKDLTILTLYRVSHNEQADAAHDKLLDALKELEKYAPLDQNGEEVYMNELTELFMRKSDIWYDDLSEFAGIPDGIYEDVDYLRKLLFEINAFLYVLS